MHLLSSFHKCMFSSPSSIIYCVYFPFFLMLLLNYWHTPNLKAPLLYYWCWSIYPLHVWAHVLNVVLIIGWIKIVPAWLHLRSAHTPTHTHTHSNRRVNFAHYWWVSCMSTTVASKGRENVQFPPIYWVKLVQNQTNHNANKMPNDKFTTTGGFLGAQSLKDSHNSTGMWPVVCGLKPIH